MRPTNHPWNNYGAWTQAVTLYRSTFCDTLKRTKQRRVASMQLMLGYTPLDFQTHLQNLFRDGMSWENWGRIWELDHIRGVAQFVKDGVTDLGTISALSNLQPLLIGEHAVKFRAVYKRITL